MGQYSNIIIFKLNMFRSAVTYAYSRLELELAFHVCRARRNAPSVFHDVKRESETEALYYIYEGEYKYNMFTIAQYVNHCNVLRYPGPRAAGHAS